MKHELDHERLDVYRLARDLARWVRQTHFPAGESALRDQAKRAAHSVALNTAEDCNRSGGDRLQHFRIAKGSAAECCAVTGLLDLPEGATRQQEFRRVVAMLCGLRQVTPWVRPGGCGPRGVALLVVVAAIVALLLVVVVPLAASLEPCRFPPTAGRRRAAAGRPAARPPMDRSRAALCCRCQWIARGVACLARQQRQDMEIATMASTSENEESVATEAAAPVEPDGVIDVPARLGGGREIAPELLDSAVAWLNDTWTRKGMEVVLEVGRYILDTFFAGEPDSFQKHGREHATFRQLAERTDLRVSHLWIWRAVSIVVQLRALPEGAATRLPYTHHALLLPLKDQGWKAKLATRAMDRGLSKRAFEKEVAKARADERRTGGPGRRPLPRFVKTLNRVEKLATGDEDLWGDLDDVAELDMEQAKRLYAAADSMKARCDAVQEAIRTGVDGFETEG